VHVLQSRKKKISMARSAFSKVMWVGRATVFMVGLAVVLALLFGVATTALGATGGNFILGQSNVASPVSRLVGNVAGGHALQVSNQSTETGSRALQLGVAEGKAPLAVNAMAGTATNLNADELDGKTLAGFWAEGRTPRTTTPWAARPRPTTSRGSSGRWYSPTAPSTAAAGWWP
jgi:hypothetical protein